MRRLFIGLSALALLALPSVVLAAPGDPDPGFGTSGVVTGGLLDEFGPLSVDSSGRSVVLGTKNGALAVARYLTTGQPDTSFSGDGRAELGVASVTAELVDVRALADGSIVAAGRRTTVVGQPFSNGLWTARLSETGAPVAGYGTGGVATFDQGYTAYAERGSIGADGSVVIAQTALGGNVVVGVSASGTFAAEQSLTSDGTVFGPGCVQQSGLIPVAVAAISATEFVHLSYAGALGNCGALTEALVVTRQTLPDAVVWARLIPATESVDLDVVQTGMQIIGGDVLFGTTDSTTAFIRRLSLATGAPVASWGTNGRATLAAGSAFVGDIAALADGKVGVVNAPLFVDSPTSIVVDQLLSNGTADPAFPRLTTPVTVELTGTAIAGAPDGGIHVTAQHGAGTLRRYLGTEGAPEPDAVPLAPGRLLDTRSDGETVDDLFEKIGRPAAGSVTKVRIAGRGGVPADASAAIVNLTLVAPSAAGYATIYPCTPEPPNASNINYSAGAFVANSVTAKLDANGDVCVFTLASADLLIDTNGYVPNGSGIGTLTPARLLDTRGDGETVDDLFEKIGRPAAGSVTKVRIAGRGGVPADASAAIVNLTLVAPSAAGYATIYPCTPEPPNASNVNYAAGAFVANSVTAKLDANGDVCVFTLASSDLLIDASAYAAAGSAVGTLTPARLLDTRATGETVDDLFEKIGTPAAGSVTTVRIAGRGGVPANATAAIVNLTIAAPASAGFATIYPCTPEPPNASNINYTAGAFVANGVTAKLDANGDVCIFTLAAADILVDANGYLTPVVA